MTAWYELSYNPSVPLNLADFLLYPPRNFAIFLYLLISSTNSFSLLIVYINFFHSLVFSIFSNLKLIEQLYPSTSKLDTIQYLHQNIFDVLKKNCYLRNICKIILSRYSSIYHVNEHEYKIQLQLSQSNMTKSMSVKQG